MGVRRRAKVNMGPWRRLGLVYPYFQGSGAPGDATLPVFTKLTQQLKKRLLDVKITARGPFLAKFRVKKCTSEMIKNLGTLPLSIYVNIREMAGKRHGSAQGAT